jgi:hypothetical protein
MGVPEGNGAAVIPVVKYCGLVCGTGMASRLVAEPRRRGATARAGEILRDRLDPLTAKPRLTGWPNGLVNDDLNLNQTRAGFRMSSDKQTVVRPPDACRDGADHPPGGTRPLPLLWSHHQPWNGAVLDQRPMWARMVIVLEVVPEDYVQVSFAEDDHLVQTVSANGPDQSFRVRILPRRVRGCPLFRDTEGGNALGKLGPVGPIAVAQQVFWRRLKRKRVDHLLAGPTR